MNINDDFKKATANAPKAISPEVLEEVQEMKDACDEIEYMLKHGQKLPPGAYETMQKGRELIELTLKVFRGQ